MKLHSPVFEKTLRKGVRTTVRADPALRKESKRVGRGKKVAGASRRTLGLRFALAFILAAVVGASYGRTKSPEMALLMLNLWIAISFCSSLTFNGGDAFRLSFLPVSEMTIARWEIHKYFRNSFCLLAEWTAGLGAIGLCFHFSVRQWVAAILVVPLAWIYLLALAAFLIFRWPSLPYVRIARTLFGLTLLGWISSKFWLGQPAIREAMVSFATAFNFLVPTGWPAALLSLGNSSFSSWTPLLLLPVGGVLVMFRSSVRGIESRFGYREAGAGEGEVPLESASVIDLPRPPGLTEIKENLLSGDWLARKAWPNCWLENKLWNRLSEREKDLMDFNFPGGWVITGPWKSLFGYFVVIAVFGGIGSLISPTLGWWIYGPGFSILILLGFVYLQPPGRALGSWNASGVVIPCHAAYPIGHRELSRLLLKCSDFQMPLLTLFLVACFLAMIPCSHFDVISCIGSGISVAGVLWGGYRVILIAALNSESGDKKTYTWRSFAMFVFFIVFGMLYLLLAVSTVLLVIVGGVTGEILDMQPVPWIFSLLTALIAFIFYRLYLWLFGFLRFDLMQLK